ncbi:Uncharacterized protein FWK35_00014281, partial [Aphis craccivora]
HLCVYSFEYVPALSSLRITTRRYTSLVDYTLRVVEHGDYDEAHSFGFEAGRRFPWTSLAASSLNILELLSTEFPRDNEILNDAQSFHWSHTGGPSSDDNDKYVTRYCIRRRNSYQDST